MRFFILILFVFTFSLKSQTTDYRRSPVGLVYKQLGDMYLKITYTRPQQTSDKFLIFGSKVKYNKLWRTGDDEVPELTVTDTIIFVTDTLPPGTYSLFTIPDSATWTIILNTNLGQRGLFKYNTAQDYCRNEVESFLVSKFIHSFTIDIKEVKANESEIVLLWGRTAVSIPIYYD